jgi:tetratricopeptide (TPR) repeat protein
MGAQTLASGNIRQAVVVFNDCSNIAVQMFGVFHKSAAECSRQLAKCAYLLQDLDGAVEFEQRALLIYQRLTGLDSALTAQSHAKLALYLNAAKHPRVCLKHLRRALFLFELISGPNHPSTCNVYSNMGTILQELGKLDVALKYHKEALARTEMVYGDQAAQTGIAHHSVGMCYALNRDLRYASMHMQQSSTILKAKMGENHMYTIRSKLLLGEFLKILKSKGGGMEKQIDALQSNLFRSLSSSSWAGRDKKMKFQSRLTVDDVLQQAYSTPDPKQVDSKPALSKKARKRAAQKAKKVAAKAEEATVANGDGDGAEAKTDTQQS